MIENQGKPGQKIVTIFDDIYNLPDCRSYYRAMSHAGFRTAHYATTGFRTILTELKRLRGLNAVSVVDFASGYGIAAALMRHDVSLDDVLGRYVDPWFDDAATEAVIAADKDWLSGFRRAGDTDTYCGVDIADQALAYGGATGIFDTFFADNLQDDPPSAGLKTVLNDCDLVVECGSVAHMLPRAFDRLLDATGRRPWVATSPIRGNDSAEAFDLLKRFDYRVEVYDAQPFRHRRFAEADEQARAIVNAQARGHDTDGYESEGYFHAQIYLARPEEEATPISDWRPGS